MARLSGGSAVVVLGMGPIVFPRPRFGGILSSTDEGFDSPTFSEPESLWSIASWAPLRFLELKVRRRRCMRQKRSILGVWDLCVVVPTKEGVFCFCFSFFGDVIPVFLNERFFFIVISEKEPTENILLLTFVLQGYAALLGFGAILLLSLLSFK